MPEKVAFPDVAVAAIARKQHGVVSTRQLRLAGLTDDGVLGRVRSGRLHRLHQGVYAVGHLPRSSKARWMAAVLAVGARGMVGRAGGNGEVVSEAVRTGEGVTVSVLDYWGAAVSHRSAACLWQLLAPREGLIDVSIPSNHGRSRRKGIRLHRAYSLLTADVTLRDEIPVTTPARTIADLRRVVSRPGRPGLISPHELRRAIRQAEVLGPPLGDEIESDRTRSDLERDFLRLCRRNRLPLPEVNVPVGPHLVDFLWHERKLIVETDGFAYHRGRVAFQDDRARDLDLRTRGYDVIRLSEAQINDDAEHVVEVLRQAV